ncbi:hypothetical protein [Lacipirellula sp.]|uniref:hypothetical protein n=1 Tax=Lacipirellula sp. TaxID=2691419 RepID=UPI003D134334
MSSSPRTLTEDEISLRVAAPVFFEELIGAHTASLVEKGDPEAFTSWKEIRQQSDREFASLSAEELLQVNEQRQAQPFERQSIEFAAALTRFAAEADIPLDQHNISPHQAVACYSKIIRNEWEQDLAASEEGMPREDLRFVAAREIEQSKAEYLELTEPAKQKFGEMSQAARNEFLDDQRQVGQAALQAQRQSLQQSPARDIDPPEHDD